MGKACKEHVHIKLDKELYDKFEKMRKLSNSTMVFSRSGVYGEALFYGCKVLELKRELGEKDFDRVWNLLNKLNLSKLNLEKLDLSRVI